jgi:PTS system fructose-specific IIA component/PTS system nitrogen regulatory IIA component
METSRMKFSDFICSDALVAHLQSVEKEEAVREIVQALVDARHIERSQFESIVRSIIKREELGSTGIGRGVAVPHAKHPSVDRLVGTVAVSQQGVNFAALDGEKVYLFFLLISPERRHGEHLRALEYVSRLLRCDMFTSFLKQAKTVADIQQVLDEADDSRFGV